MRFQNNVIDKKVAEAVKDAEALFLPSSLMMQELRLKNDFKYNSGSGEEIYQRVLSHEIALPVFTYKPVWRFTKAIGYFDGKATHINILKLPCMKHEEVVANLCHEKFHQMGWSHGNNYKTKDKVLFSVPYFVSENIKRWL